MLTYEKPWLRRGETLLCFGDSITESKDGYTRLLKTALAAKGIKMIRSGRGGDKTPWALTRFERDVIRPKPDAVSIFLGTNDCAIGRGRWADEPTVPAEAYATNLRWMVHLCRKAGIEKISITPPLFRFEGESWGEYGEAMLPHRQAARDAADSMRVRFVPADIAFSDEWARHPGHTGLLLTTDGVHLNQKGCEILVRTMLESWGLI